MRKYLFITLIMIIIISLLAIYFLKIKNNLEDFLPLSQHSSERAFTSDSIQSAVTTIVDAVEAAASGATSEESSTATGLFLIYIDRYYKIDTEPDTEVSVIYSRYINGGEWFKLCDNYTSGSIPHILKDITIHKNDNGQIYVYALYSSVVDNKICRRNVDDYEDNWEHLTLFSTIDKPNQIYSSSNYLLVNANSPSDSSDDNSDNFGVFSYNFESEQLEQISSSTDYLCIRVNLYLSRENFYGIFNEGDDQLTVKKAISDESDDDDLEYDDSFDFDITFVDLYETSHFIYGLGNDSYVYRKSSKMNVLGNESSSWYKVSSRLSVTYFDKDIGISKKLSVFNGYIYCLVDDKIMKHRINGYTWIEIDNFNFENQYYGNPPSIIINRINKATRNNIDPDVINQESLGDFKFGTYHVDDDSSKT